MKGPHSYEGEEPQKPAPITTNDDTSTLKQELSRAWKRIADLETRIHDLTLQSTMVSWYCVHSVCLLIVSSYLL